MKRNVLMDGNGSDTVMIEGLGPFVPMSQVRSMQAEVERLQAEIAERDRRTHIISPQVFEGALKERDQLKAELYKYGCEDVDVIRCLKTLAYEHNHLDVPRYKDLAKRTMDKYVERCTSVGSTLAARDAAVIERETNRCISAVEAEPEYPGDAPQELMTYINQCIESKDANHMLHMMRMSVRLTKLEIINRIQCRPTQQEAQS